MPGGWANPLPFQIGGDPTPTEEVYAALRSAAGTDAKGQPVSGPADGLRDLWTQCKAQVIAASAQPVERAMLQAFPAQMTDWLDVWELLLGVPRQRTLVERQAAVGTAYTNVVDATVGGIRASLKRIDPAFDVGTIPYSKAIVVQQGKAFGSLLLVTAPFVQPAVGSQVSIFVTSSLHMADLAVMWIVNGGSYQITSLNTSTRIQAINLGGPGNAAPGAVIPAGSLINDLFTWQNQKKFGSAFPNFSDGFVLRVIYTLGVGQVAPPGLAVSKAAALLSATLPGWFDWQIGCLATGPSGQGFYADGFAGSKCDVTLTD